MAQTSNRIFFRCLGGGRSGAAVAVLNFTNVRRCPIPSSTGDHEHLFRARNVARATSRIRTINTSLTRTTLRTNGGGSIRQGAGTRRSRQAASANYRWVLAGLGSGRAEGTLARHGSRRGRIYWRRHVSDGWKSGVSRPRGVRRQYWRKALANGHGGSGSDAHQLHAGWEAYVSVVARSGPATRVFTFVLDGKALMPPAPPPAPARGQPKQ